MVRQTARTGRTFRFPASTVFSALSDFTDTRVAILTSSFSDFEVTAGGIGSGTRAQWNWAVDGIGSSTVDVAVFRPARNAGSASSSSDSPGTGSARTRRQAGDPLQLVEKDQNSELTVQWTVTPRGRQFSHVDAEISWKSRGIVETISHRAVGSRNVKQVYSEVLRNLDWHLRRQTATH